MLRKEIDAPISPRFGLGAGLFGENCFNGSFLIWGFQQNAEVFIRDELQTLICTFANIDGKPEDFTMLFIKSSPAPDILDQAMLTPLIPDAEPTDIELAAMGIYPAEYISKLYN